MVAYAAQNTNKHGQTPLGPYSAGANALPCFDNTSVTRASTAEIGMHYCDQLLHGYHSLHLAKMNATATPKSSDRSSADIITELTCGLSGAHIIATAGIRHREAMRTATLDDHLIAPSSYDSAEQHQPKISLWKRSSGNTSRPGTLYPYQHSGLVSLCSICIPDSTSSISLLRGPHLAAAAAWINIASNKTRLISSSYLVATALSCNKIDSSILRGR